MRIGVRRVTGHRSVIEEVFVLSDDPLVSAKINVRTTFACVVPGVTWLCDLIIPPPARHRGRIAAKK